MVGSEGGDQFSCKCVTQRSGRIQQNKSKHKRLRSIIKGYHVHHSKNTKKQAYILETIVVRKQRLVWTRRLMLC